MRRAFVLIAAILAACGGGGPGGAVPIGAPSTPAVWPLRGTPAPNADAIHNRPLVIKVANGPAARPQSGMSQADLVLEIPVEGGITRYALVFQSEDPAKVGPVRSARQSDLNYLPALHAILAHVGASESVTQMVRDAAKSGSFVDIDEFQHADAFDPASASYHRTQGGAMTMDADAKKEVMPDNVVVIKTEVKEIPGTADVTGAPSVDFRATGTGTVVILRDGKRFDGTWTRNGTTDLYRFTDSAGAAILLKPGLTWIHIVPDDYDLSS